MKRGSIGAQNQCILISYTTLSNSVYKRRRKKTEIRQRGTKKYLENFTNSVKTKLTLLTTDILQQHSDITLNLGRIFRSQIFSTREFDSKISPNASRSFSRSSPKSTRCLRSYLFV